MLSGFVPDLVLSLRQTEAVQHAGGQGMAEVWESQTTECTRFPPDTEAAGGAVPQTG